MAENVPYIGLAKTAVEAIDKALDKHIDCAEIGCKHYIRSLECLGEPDFWKEYFNGTGQKEERQ